MQLQVSAFVVTTATLLSWCAIIALAILRKVFDNVVSLHLCSLMSHAVGLNQSALRVLGNFCAVNAALIIAVMILCDLCASDDALCVNYHAAT